MSLSGHITGCVIGLFAPCKTCHSDKDPLWQRSSGDSLFGRGLDRKMATLRSVRVRVHTARVFCSMGEDAVRGEDLLRSMC